MELPTPYGLVRVFDEPTYRPGSRDNVREYERYVSLAENLPTSVHGVEINGSYICAVGAAGGCSAVHQRSAAVASDRIFVAVGDHVVCLSLHAPHALLWSTCVDDATCFGVYWDESRQAIFSHGELQIMRLTPDGKPVWSASGADVFSEGFRLLHNYVEAMDFDHRVYRFDYERGELIS
jgi:hypothetical protein